MPGSRTGMVPPRGRRRRLPSQLEWSVPAQGRTSPSPCRGTQRTLASRDPGWPTLQGGPSFPKHQERRVVTGRMALFRVARLVRPTVGAIERRWRRTSKGAPTAVGAPHQLQPTTNTSGPSRLSAPGRELKLVLMGQTDPFAVLSKDARLPPDLARRHLCLTLHQHDPARS